MHKDTIKNSAATCAGAAGVIANIILGASALYWKELGSIPAPTLLGYRIMLSFMTLAAILAMTGSLRSLAGRIGLRLFAVHTAAAIFVVINWGTFIWASIHGRVIESGLGYLLAPFVAIAVGALMSDKMSRLRLVALAIITAAVGYLLQASGDLSHWVYLTIGATWGAYACLKKYTSLNALDGLFVETVVLAGLLPLLMLVTPVDLTIPDTATHAQLVLLILCGAVSVVPLALFSFSAARLPLSVMGIFQFVLPSTQLIVALTIYHQPASNNTLACFSVIWLCLVLIVTESLFLAPGIKQAT